ncbi:hypothetical protein [Burkholderia sp. 22PA0106]|uniref:hypothetical protein n=1 Tax=Burkholderia sp. 22PA0106 TaxID=3237371 RepID=UPI0039C01592
MAPWLLFGDEIRGNRLCGNRHRTQFGMQINNPTPDEQEEFIECVQHFSGN